MIRELELGGFPLKWTGVPAEALGGLEPHWRATLAGASGDPVFRGYIEGHAMAVPPEFAWARTALVAALGYPLRLVPFRYRGRLLEAPLPPSYYEHTVGRAEMRAALSDALGGARVEDAWTLPLKLLAASAGLGRYGRHGIVAVEGLGTAHALKAFWTDAPSEGFADPTAPALARPFPGPRRLERCADCSACVSACPVGAVPAVGGPVDAARCVSLWNETDRDLPFAAPPRAHNALMGCVACQLACPENRAYAAGAVRTEPLGEGEVEILLRGAWDPSERAILSRLLSSDEEELLRTWVPIMRRNLGNFIAAAVT